MSRHAWRQQPAMMVVGAFAMVPWYYRGVEGKGRSLEQMTTLPKGVQAPAVTDR